MNDAKQTFKELEQSCKLLYQQQMTFINALERTRENAHDRIKPVRNLEQVRSYLDNYCNNSTDRRILSMFLSVCADLTDFSVNLAELQSGTKAARDILEENMNLLNPDNDISGLRAKYPHDVVNHLSCDEAKNFYGGVVSLIPILLDNLREAISRMEKTQSDQKQPGSNGLRTKERNETNKGEKNVTQTTGVQTMDK
ncbi:sperm acrosome-associated protein 9 isoform X2 [Spea bombifrons]|uniref:sperm acrosome-associated protein 9 isoform X2 n=1 Tax=Spea bombifrons TaxID=233779 RepID=UPI00234B1BEB|nr:sperm acrosome-associated protein 9 isoform X2 [Spea bombifrons]